MELLPLSTEPFSAPTDREMLPSERRAFALTHRTCIFGYGRRRDGPAMSVVYYIPTDSGELLVSTMRERAKAKATSRLGKVSLCILDETWPFTYLQVYCDAEVVDDAKLTTDVMMAVAGRMSGTPLPEAARPVVEKMAAEEDRIVVRCRPYETFAKPSRHLHENDQEEELTHWVSRAMAWDAPDPS